MKKILLSLSLLTLTLHANSQTQIGNSGFESWETTTDETAEPINWNSFMTADATGIYSAAKQPQMDRSTDKRPGSAGTYSVKIWTRNVPVFNIKANGNMTLGRIKAGSTTPDDPANHNKTIQSDPNFSEAFTDTPDSVVFWVKYVPVTPSATLKAKASFVIHKSLASGDFKDPNDVAGANAVASAITEISYNAGNWQRIAVKFNYLGNPADAAFIIATFASCYVPGGGNTNDALFVDDIELVYVPKAQFTASATSVCAGGSLNFTSTSTNHPTTYSWNFGDGTPVSTAQNPSHTFATAGTYNVTLTATNQWGSNTSVATTITVNPIPDASLSYAQTTYCPADTDPVPTATNAGTFTSTSGLIINSTTGAIDLSASTPGTYTVTNTYNGTCSNTGTTSITINPPANSTFAYPSNTICVGGANETPTVADAGTFSATPAGLVFVSTTTGEINVGSSAPGTYAITYNATGSAACPTSGSSSTVNLTITSSPDASFSYSQAAYCASAIDPAPVFGAGASGGVFSSTTGLNINASTGVVDLSTSTAGTYTVTNSIAASGSCPATSSVSTITVNPLPLVTLPAFDDVCVYHPAFALTSGTPAGGTYSGNGVTAGTFNPSAVSAGTTVVITYQYTDPATTCSNSSLNSILVEACLGLDDKEVAAIAVYPNPTDGKLTLTNISENASFKVVSVSGQVVLDGIVSATANTIDLSSFENGIYVLQLTQGQGLQSIRIVKN